MKQQADRNRMERVFDVGDRVFVKLHPYKKLSSKQRGKTIWHQGFMDPTISRKILAK